MRVALYARVSTESQQARGTIGSQLAVLRERVGAEGDEVVAEFCDDGHSGARLDRPGPDRRNPSGNAGQTGNPPTPTTRIRPQRSTTSIGHDQRWIQAQADSPRHHSSSAQSSSRIRSRLRRRVGPILPIGMSRVSAIVA
jgi:hypothetical protein